MELRSLGLSVAGRSKESDGPCASFLHQSGTKNTEFVVDGQRRHARLVDSEPYAKADELKELRPKVLFPRRTTPLILEGYRSSCPNSTTLRWSLMDASCSPAKDRASPVMPRAFFIFAGRRDHQALMKL